MERPIAIIQRITKFVPISPLGHLILLPKLTDLPGQGPLIDVAVHIGALGIRMATPAASASHAGPKTSAPRARTCR